MDIKQDALNIGLEDCYNPQDLIGKIAASEQEEAVLYAKIAQAVPCEELRRIICHKAKKEWRMAERLAMLSQCFGAMPAAPPVGAMPFSMGEGNEKE
ncbi:MAG: hypothetical protein A4E55_02337 [Pelotomaculum sp. PtaU1.Bin035]|nr:MAG: hypothetical protein A4E55_02337 [Pelotomaculum sp. PtaU1.Bin035]